MAFCVLCVGFVSCKKIDVEEHTVHACAPMPKAVAAATAFVVNGKAYVFGGRAQNDSLQNTLWEYNPTTDQWTFFGKTPLSPRANATACVVNDTVYLGLGYRGKVVGSDSLYLCDFWQFVPADTTWKRLPDYPIYDPNGCVAFHDEGSLYVGCGFGGGFAARMCRFDVKTHEWYRVSPVEDQRATPSMAVCGAQTETGRCFVGTGYNLFSNSNWYEFNPATGGFLTKASLPTQGRDCATATATTDYVYVIGGQHFGGTQTTYHAFDDILRYSPASDSWKLVGTLPVGALKMIAFSLNNRIYCGLGEDKNGKIYNQLYYIEE